MPKSQNKLLGLPRSFSLLQCSLLLTCCSPFVLVPFDARCREARTNKLRWSFLLPSAIEERGNRRRLKPTAAAVNSAAAASGREESASIHPDTIAAIAEALNLRARNEPDSPLRRLTKVDDVEQWEVAMAAGKIAQDALRRRKQRQEEASAGLDQYANSVDGANGGDATTSVEKFAPLTVEEESTVGGRTVAVVVRFDDLESELRKRCREAKSEEKEEGMGWDGFGVLKEELFDAYDDDTYDAEAAAEMTAEVDSRILADPTFVVRRAECLLAIFLECIEGPGLKRNGATVPCMDVDFLDAGRYDALFSGSRDAREKLRAELREIEKKERDDGRDSRPAAAATEPARPSLHPIAIDAVARALALRAQNKTTSPLRELDDGSVEFYEIQLAARRVAERAVTGRKRRGTADGTELTDEEAATVAGRIVAVVTRFDDLEWELNDRVKNGGTASAWVAERDDWDSFGVLEDETCVRTVDERILSDPVFATKRAERLLALLLLNLEGPGLEASGKSVPGGSHVDYLEEEHYRLMMPKKKKRDEHR